MECSPNLCHEYNALVPNIPNQYSIEMYVFVVVCCSCRSPFFAQRGRTVLQECKIGRNGSMLHGATVRLLCTTHCVCCRLFCVHILENEYVMIYGVLSVTCLLRVIKKFSVLGEKAQ